MSILSAKVATRHSDGYADAVSDEDFERIAESMHEDHTEYGGYWVALKDACDDLKIPKLQK